MAMSCMQVSFFQIRNEIEFILPVVLAVIHIGVSRHLKGFLFFCSQ